MKRVFVNIELENGKKGGIVIDGCPNSVKKKNVERIAREMFERPEISMKIKKIIDYRVLAVTISSGTRRKNR